MSRYACRGCRFETDDVYQALEHLGARMGCLVLPTENRAIDFPGQWPDTVLVGNEPGQRQEPQMTRTATAARLETPTLKIKSGDRQHGWLDVRFSFDGEDYKAQAQIFSEPSDYGILAGRISRLSITHLGDFEPVAGDPDTMKRAKFELYNYDRGLDFDRAPAGLVDALVAYLEGR